MEAWFINDLGIEEVLSAAVDNHVHICVVDLVKSFDTVDRFDRVLSGQGTPAWLRH